MKKFMMSVLLLPAVVFAQQQQQQPQEPVTVDKKVTCASTELVMRALESSEYKEIPYWMGTDGDSYWGMLVNENTKTWTIIQFNRDVACIIGSGKNHGHMLKTPR